MLLEGKNIVLTGANRGIGNAMLHRFAEEGANLWAFARRPSESFEQDCRETAERCGVWVEPVYCELTDAEALKGVFRQIMAEKKPLHGLVNNAGVAGQALFQDITDALWRRYFAVNVDGAFHTIQAVLPHMLHEHAGCIINVSSIWGLRGASCEVTYSATKGALIALTRSLASELAPTGIRVNCVAPGVIKTDMLDALPPEVLPQLAQETPLGRLGTPEDIAAAVSFLADEKASFITGQVLTCDGGFIL